MTGSAAKVTVRKLFDYLPGRFTPLDAGFVVREIEGALRVGETTADCWSARDWKPQLRIWLQRATEQVQGKLMDQDGFTEYCASFDDCWRIIGSAALLQSAHGLFGDLSLMNLHQFYIDMRADTPTTAIKIKRRRLKVSPFVPFKSVCADFCIRRMLLAARRRWTKRFICINHQSSRILRTLKRDSTLPLFDFDSSMIPINLTSSLFPLPNRASLAIY